MIGIAIEEKEYEWIHQLAMACPDAFDIRCTCNSHLPCDCHAEHPIMRLLDDSKVAKWRSQLVSVLLKNSENQKNKTAAILNKTAELESKLEAMKTRKEHAQNALTEESKRVASALIERKKLYKEELGQEKQQVASLKEQVDVVKKRSAALSVDKKEYAEQLEQEKKQVASLKEQVDRAEKRMQSFEATRKSESKLLSRLLPTGDD
jgi:chromosome segregation ATPase